MMTEKGIWQNVQSLFYSIKVVEKFTVALNDLRDLFSLLKPYNSFVWKTRQNLLTTYLNP